MQFNRHCFVWKCVNVLTVYILKVINVFPFLDMGHFIYFSHNTRCISIKSGTIKEIEFVSNGHYPRLFYTTTAERVREKCCSSTKIELTCWDEYTADHATERKVGGSASTDRYGGRDNSRPRHFGLRKQQVTDSTNRPLEFLRSHPTT